MGSKISGPVAIAVIVIVALAIVGFFYARYMREPTVGPAENKAIMERAGREMQQKMQGLRGGARPPGVTPPGPAGGQ